MKAASEKRSAPGIRRIARYGLRARRWFLEGEYATAGMASTTALAMSDTAAPALMSAVGVATLNFRADLRRLTAKAIPRISLVIGRDSAPRSSYTRSGNHSSWYML